MCGVAGILRVHGPGQAVPTPESAIEEAWLHRLDEAISHRGPDGEGRFRDRATRADGSVVDVALVHRRLAIIDPEGGDQPMLSKRGPGWPDRARSGRLAVVFNGCLYNHGALRSELTAAGHAFLSGHSDTEVFLHGWRRWGVGLFPRLEGMFAAAVWDQREGALVLARDLFGEKPLYLVRSSDESGDWAAFASTPRALYSIIARGFGGLSLDHAGRELEEWLRFGFAPSGPCGCEIVPPGAVVAFEAGGLRAFDTREQALGHAPGRPEPLTAERAEKLLGEAVAERLEADAPLGCFLSGGVDSSLIALLARRRLGTLRTFTVRMPDASFDESRFASAVASAVGTRHSTLDCDARPAEDLEQLISQLGLPFGDSSLLPAHWLSRAARQHVKVALSGDGGDELFGGYDRYLAARWMASAGRGGIPAWVARRALRRFARVASVASVGAPARSRRVRATRALAAAAGGGYLDLVAIFPRDLLARLLGREPAVRADEPAIASAERAMAWDMAHYLPDDLLRKTDTASMAVALEVRCPFLDPTLIAACRATPAETLMPAGERKGLLRAVARRHLPSGIVDRPKMGFAIPLGRWFREDYGGLKRMLLDHLNSAEPWGPASLGLSLDRPFVRRLIDEHMRGDRDHAQRLYLLLATSIWAKSIV